MSRQSHYEINVSKNGAHFFATHERSAVTSRQAQSLIDDFVKRFPKEDGFEVRCTYWNCTGREEFDSGSR